jgi:photosystem II stability/assembly factor-like uncharacterized protein
MSIFKILRRHRSPGYAASIALLAATLGWAGIAAATPAADTSVLAPLADRSLLVAGAAAGERLVAVGERGHVLVSDDAGRSWQQRQTPTRVLLTAVTFADANTGWAVGHDAVILRTTDAGDHWETVHAAPEREQPLLDVWFRDTDHGFAVGAYGYVVVTADGGTTWEEQPLELARPDGAAQDADEEFDEEGTDWHLNRIAVSATGRLYLAAEAGTIYRSDDEGASWKSLPMDYEGSLFGVLPLDGDALLTYGLRGHLFRSEDAGESWTEIPTETQGLLTDAVRLPDGHIAIAGLAGTLLVSDDGGHSVELHRQPGRKGLGALLAGTEGTVIALGEGGIRQISIDNLTGSAAVSAPSR